MKKLPIEQIMKRLRITMIDGNIWTFRSELNFKDFVNFLCEGENYLYVIDCSPSKSVAINCNQIIQIEELEEGEE